ncbi:MAG: hemolysin III family protein [Ilumatobacteraceae bacterium]
MPDTLVPPDGAGAPEDVRMVVKPLLRGWSHAVSFVVVIVLGLLLLALTSASRGGRLTLVVYLIGLLAMFGVSAMYHRGRWPARQLAVWRRLDHSTIFLAIAGAYTPVTIAGLDGWRRTTVLVVVWVGAALGIALQWVPLHVPRAVFTAVYVVVGWSLSIALPQLFTGLGGLGFALVLGGGCAYTAGAVVYALKRPDPWPTVFGYHEVFHLLTIVGAGLHLAVVAFVVSPKL